MPYNPTQAPSQPCIPFASRETFARLAFVGVDGLKLSAVPCRPGGAQFCDADGERGEVAAMLVQPSVDSSEGLKAGEGKERGVRTSFPLITFCPSVRSLCSQIGCDEVDLSA